MIKIVAGRRWTLRSLALVATALAVLALQIGLVTPARTAAAPSVQAPQQHAEQPRAPSRWAEGT
jgi:hypothetical protein